MILFGCLFLCCPFLQLPLTLEYGFLKRLENYIFFIRNVMIVPILVITVFALNKLVMYFC